MCIFYVYKLYHLQVSRLHIWCHLVHLCISIVYRIYRRAGNFVAMDSFESEARFHAGVDNGHTDDEIDHRLAQIERHIAKLTAMKYNSRRAEQNRNTSVHSIRAVDQEVEFGRGDRTATPTRRHGDQRSTGEAGDAIASVVDDPTELFSVAAASRDHTFDRSRTSTDSANRSRRLVHGLLSDYDSANMNGRTDGAGRDRADLPSQRTSHDSGRCDRSDESHLGYVTPGKAPYQPVVSTRPRSNNFVIDSHDVLSAENRRKPDIAPLVDREFGQTIALPVRGKQVSPTIKLDRFCGDTPIRAHLAKFENCAFYYSWSARDRLCHLKASLDGPAAQVLWENPNVTSVEELVRLLCNRFDNVNQAERFRAELRTRRRRAGESVQSLYQDIRKLMALGFPGQAGEFYEIIARDAFLEALSDDALRIRVLDQSPVTLDDALSLVCRMQAYTNAGKVEDGLAEAGHKRVRAVGTAEAQTERANTAIKEANCDKRGLEKGMADLRKEMKQLKQQIDVLVNRPTQGERSSRTGWQDNATPGSALNGNLVGPGYGNMANTAPITQQVWQTPWANPIVGQPLYQPVVTPAGNILPPADSFRPDFNTGLGQPKKSQQRTSLDRDTCGLCKQKGHWKRECPLREQNTHVAGQVSSEPQAMISGVFGRPINAETYMEIMVNGKPAQGLLDSGCDHSIVPKRMVPTAVLFPTDLKLTVANGAELNVLGQMRLKFTVQGMPLYIDLVVSDQVDELMFGVDFLTRVKAIWNFEKRELIINGVSIPLLQRPSRANVRRVFVREEVIAPPLTQVNVPVRLSYINLHAPSGDWVTEPMEVEPGLMTARTLLPQSDEWAAIRVINTEKLPKCLRVGVCLGEARPGFIVGKNSPTPADDKPEDTTELKTASISSVEVQDSTALLAEGYAHLQPMIDSLPVELSTEQKQVAVDVLKEFSHVFSKHEYDLGLTNLIECRFDTGTAKPVAEPLRHHARAHLNIIDEAVEQMLKADLIEPAASPWCANLVMVTRVDGTKPRITCDFRRLNQLCYKDKFPLPRINDCLNALNGSVYYSSLDMASSFHQLPVHPDDRDKLAFITRRGQWRYKVMPQGAANSPSMFCRLMEMVLRGLTWSACLCYIDDVIILGRSFEEHVANVRMVLSRYEAANLKLKPTKCKFFQLRLRFLGYIVSGPGTIEVDPDKASSIMAIEFPKNISELRSFLGILSYYRSFCCDFATKAEPLIECLRKNVPLIWTEERQKTFDELKSFLVSPPVLSTARDQGQYVLDTDASLVGCGACLQQWQDGQLKVISYASRTFNKAERAYCATRREVAALIFGLKRFRQFLLGCQFIARVDNAALSHYQKTREPIGQQCRYLDFIAQFDMIIQHRPGLKHGNADGLSRLRPCERDNGEPCRQCNRHVTGLHDEPTAGVRRVQTRAERRRLSDEAQPATAIIAPPPASGSTQTPHSPRQWRRRPLSDNGLIGRTAPNAVQQNVANWSTSFLADEQKRDTDIGPIYSHFVEGTVKPDWPVLQSSSPMTRALWNQWASLVKRDNVLYRIFYTCDGNVSHLQLILPGSLKTAFLELVHADAAGHLKFVKCIEHVQRRAWWLTYRRDLKLFISCCAACNSYHRGNVPKQGQLQPMVIGSPGERWVIDLSGPFCMSNGQKYIFSAIDPFSKFAVAVPIANKEASTVARVFVDNIVLKWGLCQEILSDCGKEFDSEILKEMLKILGIVKLKSTSYKPSTQGAVERWHRVFHSLMAKIVNETQTEWSKLVSYVVFCYNSTIHSATGFCPYFLMTGRLPRWNIDFLIGDVNVDQLAVPEYTSLVVKRLDWAYAKTRDHLQRAAESASHWYNSKVAKVDFKIGDRVRVYNPRRYKGRTPKWQSFFKDIAVVIKCLNDVTVVVNNVHWKKPKVVHVDKLKLVQNWTE